MLKVDKFRKLPSVVISVATVSCKQQAEQAARVGTMRGGGLLWQYRSKSGRKQKYERGWLILLHTTTIYKGSWLYLVNCYSHGISKINFRQPRQPAPWHPNKAAAARETIATVLAGADAEKLAAQPDTLTGKDYIDAYVKMAEFVTPKMQRTALTGRAKRALRASKS